MTVTGIGTIGQMMPRHRWRYTFEGKDAEGNVVFSESFVKISNHPGIIGDVNGIRFVGCFEITQFFENFPDGKLSEEELEKIKKGESTSTAILRLYTGCGDIVEEWSLGEMKVKLMSLSCESYESDELVALWRIEHNAGSHTQYKEGLPRTKIVDLDKV